LKTTHNLAFLISSSHEKFEDFIQFVLFPGHRQHRREPDQRYSADQPRTSGSDDLDPDRFEQQQPRISSLANQTDGDLRLAVADDFHFSKLLSDSSEVQQMRATIWTMKNEQETFLAFSVLSIEV
jgi:hypothetical protein